MPRFSSLPDLQLALRTGQTTCRAVVDYYLTQIEKNSTLNAYVEVWAEEARAQADALDMRRQNTPNGLGRLFGMVVSIKDNICYANHQVTASSKVLEGFTSLYSATAVERLLAEDAIIIGRTNCDQFGMGSSNENSAYGPVRNALDPERVPGGSSGGAAVSVQTDTCLAALGSDTGGSIRQPAAFCGLWGFKPTYGRISRHGLLAYGSSFDQIGVLANNPADIALMLAVIAGPDDYDSTALPGISTRPPRLETAPIRIAYFTQTIDSEAVDSGVRTVTQQYIDRLRAQG
ncbi:MAG: Asp-tRNA(Asn)/Glu-tRNA(Gln) amidotransferase subunit GatA, partial [Saprospiraceae bacterium]|nr:Asp-tRNA(Asn)/Glu-tRNA(Gln) amidotransferase subunit GatA [Saprospiraceae bacterium]